MVSKTVGRVTKTVTSSAYATKVVRRALSIVIPGSLSSNTHRKGWRHSAYRSIHSGQHFLTALRIRIGSAKVPLISTDAAVFS